jgi:hypothetical protein
MNRIKSINFEIIDICNLKCSICDIWKNKYSSILESKDIINFLSYNILDKNIDITIT